MIIPPPTGPRRTPWLRIVAAVWLIALSGGLASVKMDAVRLSAPAAPSPLPARLDALDARLEQVEQRLASLGKAPQAVAPEALEGVRTQLEERLAGVEANLAAVNSEMQDLLALQSRFDKLEATWRAAIKPSPSVRVSAPRPVKAVAPPFQVLGLEVRGGEPFVTVAPPGATSLEQLRLLPVGESEQGWRLQSIDASHAVFRVNGQTQRLVLP
ncbi:TPA: hypothetical protein NIA41_000434 [Pseudomonas aeruginosa]|nr:hypothetical protein [Pseudomonas aeruginosa]